MISGTGLRVLVEEDIGAFDAERWNAILDEDDLQAMHRFVRTCQHANVEGAVYRHVLIEDACGPAAVATLCSLRIRLDLLAPPSTRRFTAAARSLSDRFLNLRLVIGGLPVSFNQSCLRVRAGVVSSAVLPAVDGVACDLARTTDCGLICFKEFGDEELPVAGGLESLGYFRAPSLPSCRLDLPWRSFDVYLASMRSGYRRQVIASIRMARERGLLFRWSSINSVQLPDLHRLYKAVMDRAEFQLERLDLAFFETLALNFPEAEVLMAELDDQLLAYALLLHGRTRSTFLLAGIDYEQNRETHAYLNTLTEVVARCLARGSRSVELGQTSWDLKARLGASSTRRHLFLRHRRPLAHQALKVSRNLLFPEHSVMPRRVFREPLADAVPSRPAT